MENETTHITIQDTTYNISREFLNKYEIEHVIETLVKQKMSTFIHFTEPDSCDIMNHE